MKYAYFILMLSILLSCSKSEKEYVETVENVIHVPITNYEKVEYKDIGSTGYPVKVIDVIFSETEFKAILTAIDLTKFKKDGDDYFMDFASDSIKWHVAIFSKENKIRYAELD